MEQRHGDGRRRGGSSGAHVVTVHPSTVACGEGDGGMELQQRAQRARQRHFSRNRARKFDPKSAED
eukprot:4112434-Prymnesium_polylepis.1